MITLNPAEIKLATYLANKRHENARNLGITDRQMGNQNKIEMDRDGIGAEIAFAKSMNVYPDLDICEGNFPNYDVILRTGEKVDVKSTRIKNGRLLAVKWKNPTDLYVLMICDFPSYTCVGYATGDELVSKESLRDLGRGEGYVLDQSQLRPIKDLI